MRTGDWLSKPSSSTPSGGRVCSFPGCGGRHLAKGLCNGHYHQAKAGKSLVPLGLYWKPRALVAHPSIPGAMLVPLTRKCFAVIDECDAEAVGALTWSVLESRGKLYARHGDAPGMVVSLHRFIWDLSGGTPTPEVDHRDSDGLNCRRNNLRAATHSQNVHNARIRKDNTSGFKGIHRVGSRWRARIAVGGVTKNLGRFDSAEEARLAYVEAGKKYHGEFARAA